ncbi:SPOR domain-containing protein [Devosia submarina]|uniref:SPOR domain-containing protein n=1 Tax=Devosia submarina TaxID=1173082 RepID=UPI0013003706|nr:SPOR domain-containing protein [Devosia submarina]
MTAKPQPMAGNSDAADDLIAELAKLMAQDAQDTPPPKAATPSPFTVRIPGEPANAAAPRREEPVRIPSAVPPAASATTIVEPVRQQPASAAGNERDTFSFAFELGQRKEASAPAQAPVEPQQAAPTVPPEPATAPAPMPESAAPQPIEHDSIADLIAAELASEQQAAAPIIPTAPPIAAAPAEPAQRPQPAANPSADWQPVNSSPASASQDRQPQPELRPVNLQPTPRPEPTRPEQDKFKVPPVFGLSAKPATPPAEARAPEPVSAPPPATTAQPTMAPTPVRAEPAPVVEVPAPAAARPAVEDNIGLDPIDEIESLIGRAVRVDLDDTPQPAPKAERPALRSLATPQVPKQAPPPPRSVSSADEAILAAAHASGAEIGWVEAPEVDQVEPRSRREKRAFAMPKLGFSRALAGPLIALVLLLAAGFGLYWVLGLSGGESGPPPLLTADATPVKETPEPQPEAASQQQSVVFNEMEGVVPGAEEQLVSRDQADLNEVTQTPVAPDISSEGLANRKVRTVTVRPDGTIVSADNSLAGSTILPVDRPNVPEIPGAQTASPELLAAQGAVPPPADPSAAAPASPASEAGAVPPPAAPEAAALPPTPEVPPVPVVTPGATVPAVDAAGNVLPGKTTVIPLQRPSSFAQRPQAAAPTTPANAAIGQDSAALAAAQQLPPPPAAQPSVNIPGATEVPAVSNDAPAYVQLASQRTEAEARATAQGLVTRFGPLFGGANMEVQRVDLGDRGIFYRVRVPANSLEQASNICTNVKAAGGDCFTM